MRRFVTRMGFPTTFVVVAAVFVGLAAPACAADLPFLTKAPPPAEPSAGAFWAEVDALAWTVKGDHLPALVTTSSAGTPFTSAGVLGAPGTSVLFGDSSVNDGWRAGARLQAGYWLDPAHARGVEASFFDLGDASTGFAASSDGSVILARPFVDATTGLPAAMVTAFPGTLAGSISATETSRLLGAGLLYRHEVGNFGGERISALIGYRYLHASDHLGIASSTTTLVLFNGVPAGSTAAASDAFDATSDFHGVDLGLAGELARGPWTFDWRTKLALGVNINDAQINGSTAITTGGVTTVFPGGMLALPSNIGSYTQTRFAAVPELELKVGYQLTSQWRLVAGYDLIYWTGVQRAGGLIDTTVNPNLIPPPGGLVGPSRPQPTFDTSALLVQGFTFGARYGF